MKNVKNKYWAENRYVVVICVNESENRLLRLVKVSTVKIKWKIHVT